MTRTRAWALSIIATVGLLALVLSIGASMGQFGFSQGGMVADAQTVAPGDAFVNEQPSAQRYDDDGERERDDEQDDDGGDEHEGGNAYEEHEEDD